MTVSNTTRRVEYACNGSVHDFGFAFPIDAAADLVVVVRDSTGAETVLTLTTDYEISTDVADDYTDGGTVTTVTYASGSRAEKNWGSGNTLIIYRDTALTQDSTYFTNRGFRQENIERNLDKLTMIVQELADGLTRSVAAPTTDDGADMTLPNAVQRAGKYLYFDSNGLPTVVSKTLGEVPATAFGESLVATADGPSALTALGVTAFGQTILDDTTAAAARATLGVVASSITNVDDYAAGDGTTDDTAAIEAAIAAATAGSILMFGPKTYKITDEITVGKALTLAGYGYSTKIDQVTASKKGFIATVANVKFYDLWLDGVGHAAYDSDELAIYAYGASAAAPLTKIVVEKCHFTNWGHAAIYLQFVNDFSVYNNSLDGIHYEGIAGISVIGGDVSKNYINDIPGSADTSWNAYGIILTRAPEDSLVTYPRSKDITVTWNRIYNVPIWHGINTHAGDTIIIDHNIVYGCNTAIIATGCPKTDGTQRYAPLNVKITNNDCNSGVTDGSMGPGIQINGAMDSGAVVEYAARCSIGNNTITGHGLQSNADDGGIYFYATIGLVVNDNPIRHCSPSGIAPYSDNLNMVITGGSIIDVFTNTAGVGMAVGVNVRETNNTGFVIGDITMAEQGSGGTYKLDSATGVGVRIGNKSGNSGKLGLIGVMSATNPKTLLVDDGSKVSKNLNT